SGPCARWRGRVARRGPLSPNCCSCRPSNTRRAKARISAALTMSAYPWDSAGAREVDQVVRNRGRWAGACWAAALAVAPALAQSAPPDVPELRGAEAPLNGQCDGGDASPDRRRLADAAAAPQDQARRQAIRTRRRLCRQSTADALSRTGRRIRQQSVWRRFRRQGFGAVADRGRGRPAIGLEPRRTHRRGQGWLQQIFPDSGGERALWLRRRRLPLRRLARSLLRQRG